MDIRPIRTKADYKATLKEISALMEVDPAPGTAEGDRLDVLVTLVQVYEARQVPIGPPDPVEAIKFRMEQGGLSVKDLEPLIGKSNRVYEVLNRKRPLTLAMIRRLHESLGIPAKVLIAETVAVRAKLAALGLTEAHVSEAVRWGAKARQRQR
jgi:HTH-type transcriptional regulator/antitoxin HigA